MTNLFVMCPHICSNKNQFGYCKTTACINPKFNGTGLKISDKDALLEAKAKGAEYVVFSYDGRLVEILMFTPNQPEEREINIALALSQIAEMERKQNNALSEKASEEGCAERKKNKVLSEIIEGIENPKTITWNDRINQMTVEEKGCFFATFDCPESLQQGYDCSQHKTCKECMVAFFASPYAPEKEERE